MTKQAIENFLKVYGTLVIDIQDDSVLELIMDDHKCISWYGTEWLIPENNSFWNDEEVEIETHLIEKYLV